MIGRKPTYLIAGVLFFFSGALGLGYELVWIRKAALVVGASQIAMSTVLTAFFLGLGVGGLVVGRRLRSAKLSPLSIYALFELGIGIYALAFPHLFDVVESIYGALYPLASASAAALFLIRFLLLFALCLPPTVLMGGTLPLLLDGLVREDRRIGSQTSLLYGVNILGAVSGVLLTCYLAIPMLGMNGTSRLAGAGNLALGALAFIVFRGTRPLHAAEGPGERPARFFVVCASATGAVAIAWQICHARFFSLIDETTIYVTAMLLAVWLFGLAIGSLVLSPLLRGRAQPLRVVAVAWLLVPFAGLFTFGATRLIDFTPTLAAVRGEDGRAVPIDTMQVMPGMAFWSETADAIFFGPLLQIGLVVLLPVVLMGVSLPALISAATERSAGLRSIAGSLVFWNTVGSSAGAFLAGYVLLPWLGLHGSLALLGLASVAIGGAAWRACPSESPRGAGRLLVPALLAVGIVAVATFAFGGRDLNRRTIERHGYGAKLEGYELTEIKEDAVGTAYVYESDEHLVLASGAVAFAFAAKNGPSAQAIQGHLPVLYFPGSGTPRRCLGIGIGSGQSFGALLMYPIESLDVVDIFPGLVDLSLRHFAPYNHDLGNDERVTFHFDDGRHYVERAADGYYDVISMEPPPPRVDGVQSLYSVEFYHEARRALTERGVLMQWLPLYRVTPEDALGIVATQAAVFPETFILKQADEDFMLLSYKSRPSFVVDELRRRIETFGTERLLAGTKWSPRCSHEIASFEGVASMLIAGPDDLRDLEAPGPYEDDTQLLSYGSGDRWLLRRYKAEVSRISFAALPMTSVSQLAPYFSPPLGVEQRVRIDVDRAAALEFYNVTDPRRVARYVMMAESGPTLRDRVRGNLSLAAVHDVRLQKRQAFERIRAALELDRRNSEPEDVALVRRIVRNHFAVYHGETTEFVEEMRAMFPEAPLVRSMVRAFDEAERFEEERRARYWFPSMDPAGAE